MLRDARSQKLSPRKGLAALELCVAMGWIPAHLLSSMSLLESRCKVHHLCEPLLRIFREGLEDDVLNGS